MKLLLSFALLGGAAFASVSTESLLEKINNPEIAILDTRSEDAYNGWKLNGESRSGHIKHAHPFPASWTTLLDAKSPILQNLKNKKEVILYGKDSAAVETFLKKQGISSISIYEEGTKDARLPLNKLARYERLVPPSYVKKMIESNAKIYEVSWGKGEKYEKAHIPTAVHINTDLVEKGPVWNYRSHEKLETFAKEYGITTKTPVILYGPDTMAPARVAVALMAMGVKDVRILNGGFKAWRDAGYEIAKGKVEPTAVASVGENLWNQTTIIKNTPEAKKIIADKDAQLIGIRSKQEWLGETSGYSYIKPKGRIKGAIWGKAGSDAYHLEDYRSPTGKMLSEDDLKAMWKDLGIDTNKHLSFYCGTGWRAAEVFFYAYAMGLDNISLYDGGWMKWSMDNDNQIVIEAK